MDGSGPSELPPGAADPERGAGQVSSVPASPSGEVHQEVKGVVLSSVLDLSQRGLHHLEEIFKIPNIKQLHLQRNALCEIPADFFQSLPNLAWLDFRYNSIRALPSGIGSHKHLKTLLLERNPIKMLPVELGNVTTLRALNLRHCPLEFPAPLVVQKGLGAILAFLQACAMQRPPPRGSASPERVADKDAVNSQDRRGRLKEKADFLPPVEKLGLSELGKSTASPEDRPGEEEIRRFWRLRQEIVEKEREEVLAKQLLPAELPANLKAALNTKEKEHSGSRHALSTCRPRGSVHRGVCDGRRKMSSLRSILPALAPRQRVGLPSRRAEDSGALAPRGQRVRDEGAPREWRERARTQRTAEAALGKPPPPQRSLLQGRQREGSHPVRGPRCPLQRWSLRPADRPISSHVVSKIPCAVDLADNEKMPVNPPGNVRQSKEKSSQTSEEMRAFREELWEENLKQHIQKTHKGRERFRGTAPLKEMSPAARDLEIARKLQDQVTESGPGPTLTRSHRFAALAGHRPRHPPASQPQKILFDTKY
ncbi:leucine-rich repeat-containing protein 27 isoform X2 [Herpailurus yagouaroundi]|uniref:leucine-rich repeat-containing protein 27 isoform X2 n=1 Tax=Herpailurus yagouaroundi TaxID=1608482 RepID=UPI001AD61537|nr:leucine-rich repeat-containing protein 27 isoform X2 [Puma yagouaroundi]